MYLDCTMGRKEESLSGMRLGANMLSLNVMYCKYNTYANLRRLLIVRRCIDTPKWGNYSLNLRF